MTTFVADEAWALRVPAIFFAVLSVVVVALIAREVGGGSLAQGLAAWGYASGTFTLVFGHVFLTSSVDLVVWPAVILSILRALLRGQPWWWVVAGVIVGVSLYNKLLIALLLVSIVIGLLVSGPRRVLWSPWTIGGIAVALLVGAPNLTYQAANGLPQLAMGAALSSGNGDEVRAVMWPFLLILIGPPLVPFWVAGIVALIRRPQWHLIRWLVPAFVALLALVFVAGAQFYYPFGLLACLFAVGCVPVADFVERMPAARGSVRARRRALVLGALALNGAVTLVVSLPLIPVSVLGATPIPSMNQAAADQVGWPTYVAQVEAVVDTLTEPPAEIAIIASNYGEAGALDRYGIGLPPVFSGHVALWEAGPPAPSVGTVVIVGGQARALAQYFESCRAVDRLDNGVGVDTEEQDEPITVCREPRDSWVKLWPRFAHLD